MIECFLCTLSVTKEKWCFLFVDLFVILTLFLFQNILA